MATSVTNVVWVQSALKISMEKRHVFANQDLKAIHMRSVFLITVIQTLDGKRLSSIRSIPVRTVPRMHPAANRATLANNVCASPSLKAMARHARNKVISAANVVKMLLAKKKASRL